MKDIQIGTAESKFADIIWANEPITSSHLAKLSEEAFGWKKSTSFTVLKRLCKKELFKNENGTVTSLVTRGDFYSMCGEKFVDEGFGGSLPAFVAAFSTRRRLSQKQIEEIERILQEHREDQDD